MTDIRKMMGILIKDRKVLVTRTRGKDIFVGPGGKITEHESDRDALIRELREELQIDVTPKDLRDFGSYTAIAAGEENKTVFAHVFLVHNWRGEIFAANEVEEVRWLTSKKEKGIKLGSIIENEIIPQLKIMGLID